MTQASSPSAKQGEEPNREIALQAGVPQSLLGDCTIRITHSTTYEPPLYLLPELLPRVPQGSPPITAWDAVADAIDVSSSSWNIADMKSLPHSTTTTTSNNSNHSRQRLASSVGGHQKKKAPTATTLASLVASNRLLCAGLTPSVMQEGKFSAAAMMSELLHLKDHAGLSDEEGAVVMTNHFVNLLAWKKLREVNHSPPHDRLAEDGTTAGSGSTSRKRPVREGEDMLDKLRACPDPWSTETDDSRYAGEFISGREEGVEAQVALLDTLSKLYRRPWRQLRSQGCQTDHVVPPGTVNVTSPYADPHRVSGGATLKVVEDLGWHAPALSAMLEPPVRNRAMQYALVVTSTTVPDAGARRIPLTSRLTTCGAAAGLHHTSSGAPLMIDVGLGAFTRTPELLSAHHLSVLLRPDFEDGRGGARRGEEDDEEPHTPHSDCSSSVKPPPPMHLKTPTGCSVWLANYGRNGARVGSHWIHGEVRRLAPGSTVTLAGGVQLELVVDSDVNGVAKVENQDVQLASVVKQEAEDCL